MSQKYFDVVVIGSGFAGLAMGVKLKNAGVENFVILEQAGEIGGTWRDNHYPGAACDVPSHLYSFSFEPNPAWSRKYGPQSEILLYMRRTAEKYGLISHTRFHTKVDRATFNSKNGTWTVTTATGEELQCRCLVSGTGGLSRPALPDIPGLKDFKGKIFHSARWDHTEPLDHRDVVVIGTGASAIQIVPAIARKVRKLFVLQRTASWIVPKRDRAYTPAEMRLKTRFRAWERLMRYALYWRGEFFGLFFNYPNIMRKSQRFMLRHLHSQVKDPSLRKQLTPDYLPGCKRILLSNDFYPAMTLPHVTLVTSGIERITANGILMKDGQHISCDVLICATGFAVADAAAPFPIKGAQGQDLAQSWVDGPKGYRGTTVAGFPNLFMIVGPNTGLGHTSMVLMIEAQATYIADAVKKMRQRGIKSVDVKVGTQDAYTSRLMEKLSGMVWTKGGCKSWYQTASGRNATLWPGTTFEFMTMMRRFDLGAYHVEYLNESSRSNSARADDPDRLQKTSGY